MSWCGSISPAHAVRTLAAALCVCIGGLAAAAGLSTELANGQRLRVIEMSTPQRSGLAFERRYPDGQRDRQFGPGGRVDFEMGSADATALVLSSDAAGHLLVGGSALRADGRRGAVVRRFLATGQPDSAWGEQGRASLSVVSGDGQATAFLPAADGSLWVAGTVQAGGLQRGAIWRVAASGQADGHFGEQGAMLAAALPLYRVLSMQSGPDGDLLLAIQTAQDGRSWLELHRWRSGEARPRRVARQERPGPWGEPVSLALRNGAWFWLDEAQPDSAVAVLMLQQADSPWAPVDPEPVAAAPLDSPGHAAMNPYAGAALSPVIEPDEAPAPTFWLVMSATCLLLLGALGWRLLRH